MEEIKFKKKEKKREINEESLKSKVRKDDS